MHDIKWVGHPREERTFTLISRSFHWLKMKDDMQAYVKSCLVCQMDKIEWKKKVSLPHPLPIPKRTMAVSFNGFYNWIP